MTYVRSNMFDESERWSRPLLLSLGFHGLVVLVMFLMGFLLQSHTVSNWGNNEGEAVTAQLVTGAAVPIPRNEESENIVANESKGVTETPPQPKPVETEDGVTIPGKVTKPVEKAITKTNIKPHPLPTPETAVPYGEGGPVSGPYGTFTAPNTKGGFSVQNSDFGSQFAYYIDGVRRAVKNNWLLYEIDPSVKAPHRAYIEFQISRSGSASNVHLVQTSGVPTLDLSALRAIQRVDNFGRLPDGYRGSQITVEFWFDYPPK
ncbi:MAG TPA: TonB family protein [Candidatus Angelobacter sp.]|nr:TonB family protein [Candidatus Angelobacter sp.]